MRTMMQLLGAAVCKWKGTHRWMRRNLGGGLIKHYASQCARCGAVRAIKRRKHGEVK